MSPFVTLEARRLFGEGWLMVLDEAQHADMDAIEELRAIHDENGCGLVLMGNGEVLTRIQGNSRQASHAQLYSRAGVRAVQHTFNDADNLVELLDQEYGVKRGGKAGNLTFTTYDQLMKVEVSRAKIIEFGPSLAQAKELVDQCVAEWAAGADENLKALATRAFNIENGGLVNRSALFGLLRWEINDDRWREAMRAIKEAIEVRGTKRYARIYYRASIDDQWINVSLDAARA
jgi:hypothetical protein